MNAYLLVGLGGAIGSVVRYGTGVLVGRLWLTPFPLATMLINIVGSLAMGLFVGWMARTLPAWQEDARLFVAVGIFGGFTTFSAFSLDAIALLERGEIVQSAIYILGSVVLAIVGLYAGLLITRGAA
jgi:CrcB protein